MRGRRANRSSGCGSKLGGPRLYIKRDDCTGLALGGNKTRKLEFLIGEALKIGATAPTQHRPRLDLKERSNVTEPRLPIRSGRSAIQGT